MAITFVGSTLQIPGSMAAPASYSVNDILLLAWTATAGQPFTTPPGYTPILVGDGGVGGGVAAGVYWKKAVASEPAPVEPSTGAGELAVYHGAVEVVGAASSYHFTAGTPSALGISHLGGSSAFELALFHCSTPFGAYTQGSPPGMTTDIDRGTGNRRVAIYHRANSPSPTSTEAASTTSGFQIAAAQVILGQKSTGLTMMM